MAITRTQKLKHHSSDMSSPRLHVFFLPLMAPGHTNPMLDLAILLADRGIIATVLTTPSNAPLILPIIENTQRAGRQIDLLRLQFPSSDPSLPTNLTSLPSPQIPANFLAALQRLCESLDEVLTGLDHLPDCIVFDSYLPWTAGVARRLGIPSLVFHAMGFFPLCVSDSLRRYREQYFTVTSDDATVLVPNLPDRVEMKWSQLPDSVRDGNEFTRFMDRMVSAELETRGAVVNSFYELELNYADHYRHVMGRTAWNVGPVSLRQSAPAFGGKCERLMAWLDSKAQGSVVYVCFGSLSRLTRVQLDEIRHGLEACGRPFMWVVRDDGTEMVVEERGEGVVVRGWAPQRAVLSHEAVGGFVTHCGWNSVMEAVSLRVPMVTWPLFAEQFYNEKLVVDVLGVGVSVGVGVWGMEEEKKPVVAGKELERAVERLMGEEGGEVRRRAVEFGRKARRAVEEGGSSHDEVGRLVDEMVSWRRDGGTTSLNRPVVDEDRN